jgi:hypothetical protein
VTRPGPRLVAFALVLVLVFGGGWMVGAAVGPFDPPSTGSAPTDGHGDDHQPAGTHEQGGH